MVRERMRVVLEQKATALVCSAACGADLIALEVAGELRIRRRVVLPYSREQFRRSSVIDRPGDWGAIFDQIISNVEVVVLPFRPDDPGAYPQANAAIVREAERLSHDTGQGILAVVAWDGKSRGADDLTAAFREQAVRSGYRVAEVLTL